MRAYIVDDSQILRERIRRLLADHPVTIVGESATVRHALSAIPALAPDVVVLDIALLDGPGILVLEELTRGADAPRVIVFTNHPSTRNRNAYLAAGAAAFLDKSLEFARLPAAITSLGNGTRPSPATSVPTGPAAPGTHGTEHILLVEDDAIIRRTTVRALASRGYHVDVAADGTEALDRLRSESARPDLVVTDMVMPRMGGRELHEIVKSEGKAPRFLFTSGYPQEQTPGAHYLPKPWSVTELARAVRSVLDTPAN